MADNVTTDELELALNTLADSMGLSVKEYVESGFLDLSTYGTDKANILARLDAIDVIDSEDGIDTIAEKVVTLNAMFTENGDLATDVLNRIVANTAAIGAVQTDLTTFKSDVASAQTIQDANITANTEAIGNLSSTVTANKTATDATISDIQTSVGANTTAIETLNGDSTVEGSVAKAVKTEEIRAKAAEAAEVAARDAAIASAKTEAVTEANTYTDTASAALQASIDDLEAAGDTSAATVAAIQSELDATQSELDATQSGLGLNADGSFTPVDGADTLEEYVQDIAGDANTLKKAIRKVARKAKSADLALDAKIDAEVAARGVSEADLQDQIDAIAGTGSGSLGSLEDRIDSVEDIVNDTTDGNGDLVKGLTSKVSDNAGAIAVETATRVAEAAQNLADAKAYSDSKDLKAGSMDIVRISNTFRTALGLGAQNGSGGSGL